MGGVPLGLCRSCVRLCSSCSVSSCSTPQRRAAGTPWVPSSGTAMVTWGFCSDSRPGRPSYPQLTGRSTEATTSCAPPPQGLLLALELRKEPLATCRWLGSSGLTPVHLMETMGGTRGGWAWGPAAVFPGICGVTSWTSGPRPASLADRR